MPLTLVPTPIGNLEDITLRALRVLRSADLIACEDTRTSSVLLRRYEIAAPLVPFHLHNENRCLPRLMEALRAGKNVAVISDAGTPGVSDPGWILLKNAGAEGRPAVLGELAKILPPYNMNQLSLATAKFALQHHDAIQTTIDILKAERERVFSELSAIGRLKAFPSEANFITVRVPDADALFNTLKENRILIKKLHGTHPLLAQCVRITIGSPEQNDAVLDIIRKLYA